MALPSSNSTLFLNVFIPQLKLGNQKNNIHVDNWTLSQCILSLLSSFAPNSIFFGELSRTGYKVYYIVCKNCAMEKRVI